MSKKSTPVIEGQQPLFYGNGPVNTLADAVANPVVQGYLEAKAEGVPMVDVLERAIRISEALTEMGRMSQIDAGFLTAVDTPNGGRIWSHYRRGTPVVEKNAQEKLPRREERVKKLLGPATGYAALRLAPELMGRGEVDARASHTWKRFTSKFTGPENRKRRDEYRRQLSKQITAQKRLRKQLGLPVIEQIDKIDT